MAKKKTENPKNEAVENEAKDIEVTSETKGEIVTSDTKDPKEEGDAVASDGKEVKAEDEDATSETKDSEVKDEAVTSDTKKAPKKKSLKEKLIPKKIIPEEKDIPADENKDGYISAREVVNSLDRDVKISEKSEDEILANHVAKQLEENEDYFMFRIKKSVFLAFSGIIIFLLWLIPLTPYVKNVLNKDTSKEIVPEQVESPSPTPIAEELSVQRIRIKIKSENEASASMSALLMKNGFDTIDISEAEIEESGINVVVKKGDDDLRSKLIQILEADYKAGSSSSELTADSDFAAVVLIGN